LNTEYFFQQCIAFDELPILSPNQNNSMLSRILSIVLIIAHCSIGSSQKNQPDSRFRPLRTDSSDVTLQLYERVIKPNSKVCIDCCFHWFKNGKIQITKGGFDGQLLHGTYTEAYHTGPLMMRGEFNKGLREGEWREWYANGELHKVSQYKKGKLHGKTEWFAGNGELLEVDMYKKNQLNGIRICYMDSVCIKEKYHKGKLKSATRIPSKEYQSPNRSLLKGKRRRHETKTVIDDKNNMEQPEDSSLKQGKSPELEEKKARNSNK
jgi:hypothetical protein